MHRHATKGIALVLGLAASEPALAQGRPGDAAFCDRYAETAATAAEDAIALNPACLNYGTGVHGDRRMHVEWCGRTAEEEVRGAAVHIRRLAARCTQGALPTPTDYGGYDIVGNERFERPYGQARRWKVSAALGGRTFLYCVAERSGPDREVRIGLDLAMPDGSGQWQLAVQAHARKDWEGTLEVDGRGFGNGGGAQIGGTAVGDRVIAWLGQPELEGLRNGRTAILGVGKFDYDFDLEGVAAAILKIEECRSRKGVAP